MNNWTRYVTTLVFGIIILLPNVLQSSNAQLLTPEEEGCIVRQFKENAYAPFRIIMFGDPAIRNSIEDIHQDEASRWHLDRAEFEDSESPTVLNFYTDSIDDWKFTVRTSYKTEAIEPRPITVNYESNNIAFQSETFFRTGFDFCIVYHIAVREAPHQYTEEELLAISEEISKEKFESLEGFISRLTKEVTSAKDLSNIANGLAVVFIIILIVSKSIDNRGTAQLKKGLNTERQLLAGTRAQIEIDRKQEKLDNEMYRSETNSKIQNFIDQATIELRSIVNEWKDIREAETEEVEVFPCDYCNKDFETENELLYHHNTQHHNEPKPEPTQYEPEPEKTIKDSDDSPVTFVESEKDKEIIKSISKFIEQTPKKVAQILKKDTDEKIETKDDMYYIPFYRQKLSGHRELSKEYRQLTEKYGDPTISSTDKMDVYWRLKALATLQHHDKKFDPKEEIE